MYVAFYKAWFYLLKSSLNNIKMNIHFYKKKQTKLIHILKVMILLDSRILFHKRIGLTIHYWNKFKKKACKFRLTAWCAVLDHLGEQAEQKKDKI